MFKSFIFCYKAKLHIATSNPRNILKLLKMLCYKFIVELYLFTKVFNDVCVCFLVGMLCGLMNSSIC